ncbi:MAG: hypothetical protein ACYS0K_17890 [Planctomycetota bacterium]
MGVVLLGSWVWLAQAGAIGSEIQISQTEPGDPWYDWEPKVACGLNQHLVVWRGYNGSDNDVLGGLVEDSTVSQFAIADNSDEERYPDVAYNPDEDEYLVVYVQRIQETNKKGKAKGGASHVVRGRRIDANGQPLETLILSDATGDTVTSSRVAYDTTAKKYLVVWQVYDQGRKGRKAPRGSVRGASIGIDNSNSATVGAVKTYAAYGYEGPVDLAADNANGRFLVIFQGNNGTWGAHGRLADADNGDPVGPGPFLVASGGEAHSVAHGDGEYLVVLYDRSSEGRHQFKARRVDADGTGLGSAFIVFSPVDQDNVTEAGMAVEYDSTAEAFLVTWSFDPTADGVIERHIYGREVYGDGSMPADEFVISDAVNNLHPALAFDTQDFLIVWSYAGVDNSGTIRGVRWSLGSE